MCNHCSFFNFFDLFLSSASVRSQEGEALPRRPCRSLSLSLSLFSFLYLLIFLFFFFVFFQFPPVEESTNFGQKRKRAGVQMCGTRSRRCMDAIRFMILKHPILNSRTIPVAKTFEGLKHRRVRAAPSHLRHQAPRSAHSFQWLPGYQ